MAKSLILNIFGTPVPLPDPFSHVILTPERPGIVVDGTTSEVIAQLGGLENIRGVLTVSNALDINPIDAVAFGLADVQEAAAARPRISFVYRPSDPAGARENVYVDWATMFAAMALVEGPKEVLIDPTFAAAVVPVGVWDLTDVEIVGIAPSGPGSLPVDLSVTDGATFTSAKAIFLGTLSLFRFRNVAVWKTGGGATPAITLTGATTVAFIELVDAQLGRTGGSDTGLVAVVAPVIAAAISLNRSVIDDGSVFMIDVGAGATLGVRLFDNSVIDDNITVNATGTLAIELESSSAVVQGGFTGVAGSFTVTNNAARRSTAFVFQPGGTPDYVNVFDDWAAMFDAIDAVEGLKTILVDTTFESAPEVPAGTWDLDNVVIKGGLAGLPGLLDPVTLTLAEGSLIVTPLTGTLTLKHILLVNDNTTAPPFQYTSGTVISRLILDNAFLKCEVGAVPMVFVDGAGGLIPFGLDMRNGSGIITTGGEPSVLSLDGNGGTAIMFAALSDVSFIEADAIEESGSTSITIALGAGASLLGQPNLSGFTFEPPARGGDVVVESGDVQVANRYGDDNTDLLDMFADHVGDPNALRGVIQANPFSVTRVYDIGDNGEWIGGFQSGAPPALFANLTAVEFGLNGSLRGQVYRRLKLRNVSTGVPFGVQDNPHYYLCDLGADAAQPPLIITTALPVGNFMYLGERSIMRGSDSGADPCILVDVGNPFTILMGEGAVIETDAIEGTGTVNIIRLSSSCIIKPQPGFAGTINLLAAAADAPHHIDKMDVPAIDVLTAVSGQFHRVDTSGGPVAVALPASTLENIGQPITVSKTTGEAVNALSLTGTVVGAAATTSAFGSITVRSDGAGSWYTVALI